MGLLSKTSEYGVRAMIYLARQKPGTACSVKVIARDLKAPFHFLSKILQALGEAGLLHTARGAGGGVRLARPANQISLGDIVVAIEGDALFTSCFLGLPGCSDRTPCAFHSEWSKKRRQLDALFARATLERLARKGLRI